MAEDPEGAIPMELEDVDTRPLVTMRHILVVDDTPANLIALEAALAPLGRRVVTATTGDEALAHLLKDDFALILLDVQMPGIDGFETAQLIRSRPRCAHVPIIFVTGHDHDKSSVLRAYGLGAVDFLAKPVMPEVLRAKASVFITLQERTEELAAEQMERNFEKRRRQYETEALRRERDRELAAKQELARLNDALAASDRRKDTFIAILAHELRNPLAPIRSCIDLIRCDDQRRVSDKQLEILERQSGVLTRLVDDLLDVSRIKADKIELRPERVDLVEIVENAIATSRPGIQERRHALTVVRPSSAVLVIADTVRLSQVVSNLLNNAARYTPRGGRIEVAIGIVEDSAFVRVTDSGMGIPAELQASIFNMFVQERVASDGSGGLGLGLALTRRLVELHNGSITVESLGRGHGSTFEVRMPRAGASLALTPRKRTRDMEPLSNTTPAAIRTLVIDDNDDARDLISTLLTSRGYEVRTANDGPSGLAMIREYEPHVAFVDLGLPGLDGVSLAQRFNAECPTAKTRLVALTGYGEERDRQRTRDVGFRAHLVKPATAAAIFEAVAKLVNK